MKTLSSPLAASCCYNICLLVDSGVIRAAQRPTLLSWNKSEQESCGSVYTRARVHRRRGGNERTRKRDRSSRALQLLCIDAPSRVSHVKIYLLLSPPLPSLLPSLPSIPSLLPSPPFNLVAVCHSSLLPFHTVITHLYICRSFEEPLKIKRRFLRGVLRAACI